MEAKPSTNLFDYATSELSQDAFFAWLCAHADTVHRDSEVHEYARAFIRWLYESSSAKTPPYEHVEVIQQHLKIDLLLRLHGTGNDDHYLLIEDKTYTSDYGTQIKGYLDNLCSKHNRNGNEQNIKRESVLPVYLKSWVEAPLLKEDERGSFGARLLLPDIAKFLQERVRADLESEVLRNWRDAVISRHRRLNEFGDKPIKEWDIDHWYGCFHSICSRADMKDFRPGYGYVNNAAGGFMGCWLAWQEKPGEMYLYLQIDAYTGRLPEATFRIGAPNGEKVTVEQCRDLLMVLSEIGRVRGYKIIKPVRLKGGASSRFGRLDIINFFGDEDGRFKESIALDRIRDCDRMLKECAVQLGFKVAQAQPTAT
ncbi:MAG: PD-(D/E)XK nuclease family protein [Flavobacteriales bacterium]|nr:PD-(D/E)XK nuclease family protein [Flavobacteriales bacterium]